MAESREQDLVLPNIRTETHKQCNNCMRQSGDPLTSPMGRGELMKLIMKNYTASGGARGSYSKGHNQGLQDTAGFQETAGQFDDAESPESEMGGNETSRRGQGTDGSVGPNLKSQVTIPSDNYVQTETTTAINSVVGRGEILKFAKKSASSVPVVSFARVQETEGQFDDAVYTGPMINRAYDCPDRTFGDPAIVEIDKSNLVGQKCGEDMEDRPAASEQKRLVNIDPKPGRPNSHNPACQFNVGVIIKRKLIGAKEVLTCIPRTAERLCLHDSKALPAPDFPGPKNPDPVLKISEESGAAKTHIDNRGGFGRGKWSESVHVSTSMPRTAGKLGLPDYKARSTAESPVPKSSSPVLSIDKESGSANRKHEEYADDVRKVSPDSPNTSEKSVFAGLPGSERDASSPGPKPTADSSPSRRTKSPSPVSKNFKGSPSSNLMFDSNKCLDKMEPTFESQINVPASLKTSSNDAGRNDSHQKGISNAIQNSADGANSMSHQSNLPDRLFASDGGDAVAMQSLKTKKGLIFGEGSSDIPVYDYLGDFDLHAGIRETARGAGLMDLTRSQSLVMPAIFNRRDVMIVGPNKSGKTSAIILPLMSLLLEKSYYSILQPSNGPRCLIFAPTSGRATTIGQLCKQYGGRDIRTIVAYGGGFEKESVYGLTAGCDILVTTPRCWLRIMSYLHVTNIRCLCHLVLDRFDVLQELFPSELHETLGHTRDLLSVRSQEGKGWELLGLQVVVSCEKWTQEKQVFAGKVLCKPILVFTSFVEGAVLAGISHGMFNVKSRVKIDKLTHLIETFRMEKIAVGCNCAEDVYVAREAVYSTNRHIVVAHEKLSNVLVNQISSEWKLKKHPVLVFSDRVVADFNVTDANILIHFSLPASASSFTDRYITIRDAIVQRALNPNDTTLAIGYMILEEGESTAEIPFPFIVDFLKRLNVELPPDVENIVKENERHKEESKDTRFCENILQTGCCFEEDRCKWRHVLRETDQAYLNFTQGLVKVNITRIYSAVKFSVRISEYNPHPYGKGPWILYEMQFKKILQSMDVFFSKHNNRRLQGSVRTGDVVAYLEGGDESFHRAVVIDVAERNQLNEPKVVHIFALDYSYEVKDASVNLLFELPENLKIYPARSEYMYLADLKPIDLDTSWSIAACSTVQDDIESMEAEIEMGGELLGRVLFRFGNNIIVDNMRWVKHLKHSTSLSSLDLRHTILTSNSGLDNPEYSVKMTELFKQANLDYFVRKNITVPNIEENKEPPTWAHLPGGDVYTSVIIVDVESPTRFYVKMTKFDDAVISLQLDIAAAAVNGRETPLLNPHVGDICILKNDLDLCDETNRWNRCLIQDVQNETATVLMVDCGSFENVRVGQLFEIPWEFVTKLPFQAIECSLAGVKASLVSANDWCEEAVDEFNRLTIDSTEKMVTFYVKVLSSEENAERTSGRRHTVVMVNLDDGGCIMNEKLSYGIHTIGNFGVDLNELKQLYQDRLLPNQDDPPADVDEAGDWNTPHAPPTKPNGAGVKLRNDSTESLHMNFDEVSDSEIDELADSFVGKNNLEQILAAVGISSPKKEPKELKMIEAVPSNAVLTSAVTQPGGDQKTKPAREELPETGNVSGKALLKPCSSPAGPAQDRFRRPDSSVTGTAELTDCPPPPLLACCDKSPKVIWLQDNDTVTIRFMIPCLKNYELEVRDTSIIFLGSVPNGLGGKDVYGRIIEYFGCIDGMYEEIEGPSYLSIKLEKLQPGNWPRLTYYDTTDQTIVYDAGGSDSDEDADNYGHKSLEHGRQPNLKKELNLEDEDLVFRPDCLVRQPAGMEDDSDDDSIEGLDTVAMHEELDL